LTYNGVTASVNWYLPPNSQVAVQVRPGSPAIGQPVVFCVYNSRSALPDNDLVMSGSAKPAILEDASAASAAACPNETASLGSALTVRAVAVAGMTTAGTVILTIPTARLGTLTYTSASASVTWTPANSEVAIMLHSGSPAAGQPVVFCVYNSRSALPDSALRISGTAKPTTLTDVASGSAAGCPNELSTLGQAYTVRSVAISGMTSNGTVVLEIPPSTSGALTYTEALWSTSWSA
jgi:hypothetical protein